MLITQNSPKKVSHKLSSLQPSASSAVRELKDEFRSGQNTSHLSSSEQQLHKLGVAYQKQTQKLVSQTQQSQSADPTSLYPDRNGYDENFLSVHLPLPKVGSALQDKIATLIDHPEQSELKYTNFSVLMNKERRQAFYAAVNIDPSQLVTLPREDRWTIDARIPSEHQLGSEAYSHNELDRGHLVRRSDPNWGPDAALANDDGFSYANSGLQHSELNQKTWRDMENYILDQAREKNQKLTVITGPVFADDDPVFDNNGQMETPTQIPMEFWKVVVWNEPDVGLTAAAFIQSQKSYVQQSLFKSEASFDPDGISVYQIPLEKLSKVTQLDFGDLKDVTQQSKRLSEHTKPTLS